LALVTSQKKKKGKEDTADDRKTSGEKKVVKKVKPVMCSAGDHLPHGKEAYQIALPATKKGSKGMLKRRPGIPAGTRRSWETSLGRGSTIKRETLKERRPLCCREKEG